ncbi:ABC transporter substrate-binding protein [Acidisphaera sp. L21]|uniref:ABC transporter substrate-binding protein n=1 Tax=Acidisphaera sp. L21 TaxID=1641851 RepID=UPI00131CD768|nr:ABC transporter substrate-binding protein [Acidisphaera sp. L21]
MTLSRRTLLAAAAAGLPLVGTAAQAARPTDLLTFGLSGYPPNLQPWANTGASVGGLKLLMFRGLLSYAPDGSLRGELAERWEQDGPTAWVFHLRDAVFHNGNPVTSDDVRWSIEQIAGEHSTAYLRAEFQGVDHVETPDAKTVRLVMKRPTVTVPLLMASMYAPITARGTIDIGAGPFMLQDQERGVSVDLVAFDKFYRPGQPQIRRIRGVVYADENIRVTALRTGDVDLIEYVPWQSMQTLDADPALKLDGTNGAFMYLVFNGDSGPFTDARVRLAAALAIRREEIVQAAFFGRGAPLEGLPLSPESPFFDKALSQGWRYDPGRAKALLAEAGHAGGFSCSLLSTSQFGMMKSTGEVVQSHLAEIGIKADLALPDWAGRLNRGNRGQYDLSIGGTAMDNNDPDGLTSLIDGSLPPSFQRSFDLPIPEITELLAAGRAEFDAVKRKAIYQKLQSVAIEKASFVGLAWRSQAYAMTKRLVGFQNIAGALTFYSNLTLDNASMNG